MKPIPSRVGWLSLIVLALTGRPAPADAGLPNPNRPRDANLFAVFVNLAEFPGHGFYLHPSGDRVQPNHAAPIAPGVVLVAVPEAVHRGADRLAPEWLDGRPGVLKSAPLVAAKRRVPSSETPSVTFTYRVEAVAGELTVRQMGEEVKAPQDYTVQWVLGSVVGGCLLTVAAAVAVLVLLVTRLARRRAPA
jgi:hypothetical protein